MKTVTKIEAAPTIEPTAKKRVAAYTMTVYSKKKIVLKLKDGTEIEWHK